MATLLKDWHIARLIRLILGVAVIIIGIQERQPLYGIMGALFMLQAAMNVSCIGGNCAAPSATSRGFKATKMVTYEEIK